ncbi:MAG: hypothetical protein ABIZ34_08550 [Candidatus Limnocylindrales bacterium]
MTATHESPGSDQMSLEDTVAIEIPVPVDAAEAPVTVERTADARLARIHLRGGMMALARAELEQMAGALTLDTPALADLAEARWRSGDLTGAADAAQAHIDAGGIEPMALLICAEALDHAGHLLDARALAAQVLERVGGHVDRLFAGEPRSSAWSTAGLTPTPLPLGTVAWGALAGGQEVADPSEGPWPIISAEAPALAEGNADLAAEAATAASFGPGSAPLSVIEQVDAGREAGRELEAIEASISDGRLTGVAERLALLLRLDRGLAPVVLSRADQALAATGRDDPTVAALQLVRGDAFRSLGHEAEATAAYQRSLRAVAARATIEESS